MGVNPHHESEKLHSIQNAYRKYNHKLKKVFHLSYLSKINDEHEKKYTSWIFTDIGVEILKNQDYTKLIYKNVWTLKEAASAIFDISPELFSQLREYAEEYKKREVVYSNVHKNVNYEGDFYIFENEKYLSALLQNIFEAHRIIIDSYVSDHKCGNVSIIEPLWGNVEATEIKRSVFLEWARGKKYYIPECFEVFLEESQEVVLSKSEQPSEKLSIAESANKICEIERELTKNTATRDIANALYIYYEAYFRKTTNAELISKKGLGITYASQVTRLITKAKDYLGKKYPDIAELPAPQRRRKGK